MSNEQKSQDQQQGQEAQQGQSPAQPGSQQGGQQGSDTQSAQQHTPPDFDGLKDKKPEELTPEELRWMADTMPGDGPGD